MAQNVVYSPWEGTRGPWLCLMSKVKVLVSPSCPILCDTKDYNPPGSSVHGISQARILDWVAISRRLFKLMSIELVMPSNHLILCCPFLLLPSVFPSINVFSNELALGSRWPKYWSFSFSISPSNEYSGLISFRIDWLDLLAVQVTLESLLQHHLESINSSVLSFFL